MSDEDTIREDAEAEERRDKLIMREACHICEMPGAVICKCGDYWCGNCFNKCYEAGCDKWANGYDENHHPYCREHKDLEPITEEEKKEFQKKENNL